MRNLKPVSEVRPRRVACLAAVLSLFGSWGFVGCGASVGGALGSGSGTLVAAVANGPQLGYLWDAQDRSLRPILGVPGAAQFGESVVPAGQYVSGASTPSGSLALLIGADGTLYSMGLPSGVPVPLAGTAPENAQIQISPSGTSALVYAADATFALLVTHLSTTPQFRTVTLPGPITGGATSDAGTVAVAVQTGSGLNIEVVGAAGKAVSVTGVTAFGGLGFVAGGEDLLVADASASTVVIVRSASTSPSIAALSLGGLVKAPLSVGASQNARWAVVANGGDPSIVRVDLTGQVAPQRVPCLCQPSLVAPLTGNGVFRFTTLQAGPVWMADVTRSTPSMLFIPALPPVQAGAGTGAVGL